MVVAAGGLKGQEDGARHRAAGQREPLADDEILDPALLGDEAMGAGVEGERWRFV